MAYEKYIKKDGKLYGPYLYQSKRIDGKVVSEYHGQKKVDYSKYFLFAFGALALFVLFYFFATSERNITGNAILNLDATYTEGQPLEGKIRMSIQEGELVPSSSKLVLDNNGKLFEFDLKNLTSESTIEGNYYVQNKVLSGSGEGYGIAGRKEIYPQVSFMLSILSPSTNASETTTAGEIAVEENNTGILEVVSNLFLGLTPTGMAVVETENEITGEASKDKPFVYTLQEGQRAEIVPRSVKLNTTQLDDNVVELVVANNVATITTSYSETESGFGEEYLGTKKKEILIDLSSLGIVLDAGSLKINVVDQGQNLISLETVVESGKVEASTPTIPALPSNNSTTPTNFTASTVEITNPITEFIPSTESSELTSEERNFLLRKFGNTSVETKEAVVKNGFVVVKYVFGSYWVEYSYDSALSQEELQSSMNRDRTKWLRDIIKTVSEGKETETNLSSLIVDYPI